jgi:hypothetical protein
VIRIDFGTPETVGYIAKNLRQQDRDEIAAVSPTTEVSQHLTFKVMMFSREVYVAIRNKPAAAWGFVELWPHVGSCFAFGTDEWGSVMRAVTNHVRRYMLPRVIAAGYHRMECRALAGRDDVARWVALLGGQPEAVLRRFGKNGEDFMVYRWLRG